MAPRFKASRGGSSSTRSGSRNSRSGGAEEKAVLLSAATTTSSHASSSHAACVSAFVSSITGLAVGLGVAALLVSSSSDYATSWMGKELLRSYEESHSFVGNLLRGGGGGGNRRSSSSDANGGEDFDGDNGIAASDNDDDGVLYVDQRYAKFIPNLDTYVEESSSSSQRGDSASSLSSASSSSSLSSHSTTSTTRSSISMDPVQEVFYASRNGKPRCTTRFIEYVPSAFEAHWHTDVTMDLVNARKLCDLFWSPKFQRWSQTYVDDTEQGRLAPHYPPTNNYSCSRSFARGYVDPKVYSAYHYERVCVEGAEGYDDTVNGVVMEDWEEEVYVNGEELGVLHQLRGGRGKRKANMLKSSSATGGANVAPPPVPTSASVSDASKKTSANDGCSGVCGGRAAGFAFANDMQPIDPMRGRRITSKLPASANTAKGGPNDGSVVGRVRVRRTHFKTYIEPLVGLLREPRLCPRGKKGKALKLHIKYNILVKAWLLLDPLATFTNSTFPAKRYFYDLGASAWGFGAGGPSQSWFYHVYRQYCADINEIFAWEMTQINATNYFSWVPDHLKGGYHYYNHAMTPEWSHWDNPLTHILQRTSTDDFVIIKIDIDTGAVEGALIDEIMANQDIADRIDELFFEHHVFFEMLDEAWQTTIDTSRTYLDSLRMFANLRRRGIRAHSWV